MDQWTIYEYSNKPNLLSQANQKDNFGLITEHTCNLNFLRIEYYSIIFNTIQIYYAIRQNRQLVKYTTSN